MHTKTNAKSVKEMQALADSYDKAVVEVCFPMLACFECCCIITCLRSLRIDVTEHLQEHSQHAQSVWVDEHKAWSPLGCCAHTDIHAGGGVVPSCQSM